MDSWSKYPSVLSVEKVDYVRQMIYRGNEVSQMMKVVGEEGTSINDYITYLKGDFIDAVYLQQNSFDPVDNSVSTERQDHIFTILFDVVTSALDLKTKEEARGWFNQLRQRFLDYNGSEWQSDGFVKLEKEILAMIEEKKTGVDEQLMMTAQAEEE